MVSQRKLAGSRGLILKAPFQAKAKKLREVYDMTLLRIRVSTIDTDKAAALLFRMEDVATSRHTKGMTKGRMVVMDVDEQDVPTIKQLLSYYHSWIESTTN